MTIRAGCASRGTRRSRRRWRRRRRFRSAMADAPLRASRAPRACGPWQARRVDSHVGLAERHSGLADLQGASPLHGQSRFPICALLGGDGRPAAGLHRVGRVYRDLELRRLVPNERRGLQPGGCADHRRSPCEPTSARSPITIWPCGRYRCRHGHGMGVYRCRPSALRRPLCQEMDQRAVSGRRRTWSRPATTRFRPMATPSR